MYSVFILKVIYAQFSKVLSGFKTFQARFLLHTTLVCAHLPLSVIKHHIRASCKRHSFDGILILFVITFQHLPALGQEQRTSQVALVVKNPPANAGDIRDMGSIPGSGNATHSSILAWRIPWTEEPGGLQSIRLLRVRHD